MTAEEGFEEVFFGSGLRSTYMFHIGKLCAYLCNDAKRPKAGVYAPDFLQQVNIAFDQTLHRIPSGNVRRDGMGAFWRYRMSKFCIICSLRLGHGCGHSHGHDLALSCFLFLLMSEHLSILLLSFFLFSGMVRLHLLYKAPTYQQTWGESGHSFLSVRARLNPTRS